MNKTSSSVSPLNQHRRDHIIQVARQCFLHKGLSATSMADIAREAQLGAGQIYRCFKGKNEIIAVIVRQIARRRTLSFIQTNHNLELKANEFSGIDFSGDCFDEDDDKLFLEIKAHSMREPYLAEILLEADKQLKQEGIKLLRRHYPHKTVHEIAALCEVLAVLTEGALSRRACAQSVTDKQRLKQCYQSMLNALFIN